jgi:hypothetical protein
MLSTQSAKDSLKGMADWDTDTVGRQLRQIETKVTQEDSLSKTCSDTKPEEKALVYVL